MMHRKPTLKERVINIVGDWKKRINNKIMILLPTDAYNYLIEQYMKYRVERSLTAALIITYFARKNLQLPEIIKELEGGRDLDGQTR